MRRVIHRFATALLPILLLPFATPYQVAVSAQGGGRILVMPFENTRREPRSTFTCTESSSTPLSTSIVSSSSTWASVRG